MLIRVYFVGLTCLLILFLMMLCLLLVLKYYKGLKMLKRLTEEVVIPITYRAVGRWTQKRKIRIFLILSIKFVFLGSVPLSQGEYVCRNGRI